MKSRRLFLFAFIVAHALSLLTITMLHAAHSRLGVATASGSLTRITTASHSDRDSNYASINSDGTLIAFSSNSDFFHEGMPSEIPQLWLYDTMAMTLTRITSVTHNANSAPRSPIISADGSTIAFSSHDFLNEGLSIVQSEIWLYDTVAMDFTRVTTSDIGRENRFPSLSADGKTVAFQSNADLLGEGRPITQYEVWIFNTSTLTYTRITTGTGVSTRISTAPSLNVDGTFVAFQSDADLLNQGIPPGQDEIWLYNITSKEYTRITTASDTNRDSRHPHISADGKLVVFESDSDFLGENIPENQYEIWLYNVTSKEYSRITTASDSGRYSLRPRLSADGRFIVFHSNSDFLNQGISSTFTFEVWLYDTEQSLLSRITTGANNDQSSIDPSVIFDNTNLNIVFTSGAAASTPGIPTQREIWLYEDEFPILLYLPVVFGGNS